MNNPTKRHFSESEATKAINQISDRHALNRYTFKAAIEQDDEFGYLLECFFKNEVNLDNGRHVTKVDLIKSLIQFNRATSRRSSEAEWMSDNGLVKQDTRSGQVYYEAFNPKHAA